MRMSLFLGLAVVVAFFLISGCVSMRAERKAPQLGEVINVEGVDMHVFVAGPAGSDKRPVVLIHGASANLMDMKLALGDRLARDRKVIMVDRPGRGYSKRPADGYSLMRQAALIKGAVDAIGVKEPIVIGQSFGGSVALSYGLQFQDEMAGLIALAPVSHEWPGGVDWHNHVSQTPIIGEIFRRAVLPIYGTFVARGVVDASFAPNTPPADYFDRAGTGLLFRSHDFRANASDIYHLKEQIIAQQDRYGELRLPVAVAHGLDDDTVSIDLHARALKREVANLSLHEWPETGHALHHARADEVIALIEAMETSARD